MKTLKDLPIGKTATIVSVDGNQDLRQHLLDMGLIPGSEITMVKHAPMGDPIEVRIHSYELTLRNDDANKITIENIHDKQSARQMKCFHLTLPEYLLLTVHLAVHKMLRCHILIFLHLPVSPMFCL